MARLILSLDGQTLAEYNMTKERYTVGRLPDNDIRIDNAAVSGHHSLIINILNDSFLEDLNSTNGTYVNGKLIKKHALQHGDVITVGHHQLRYVDDQAQQAPEDEFEKTMVIQPSGQMEKQVAQGRARGRSGRRREAAAAPKRAAPQAPSRRNRAGRSRRRRRRKSTRTRRRCCRSRSSRCCPARSPAASSSSTRRSRRSAVRACRSRRSRAAPRATTSCTSRAARPKASRS